MSETESETVRTELTDLAETRAASLAELTLGDNVTVDTPENTYDGEIEWMTDEDGDGAVVLIHDDDRALYVEPSKYPIHDDVILIHDEKAIYTEEYRQPKPNERVEKMWVSQEAR
jgi:hypothetical protein